MIFLPDFLYCVIYYWYCTFYASEIIGLQTLNDRKALEVVCDYSGLFSISLDEAFTNETVSPHHYAKIWQIWNILYMPYR